MRKIACTATLLSLIAAAPAQAQTVPTRAGLDACHTGSAPLDRFAIFSAQMGATPATSRMQLRFDVLQRVPGQGWRRVQAPLLGVWRTSKPGIAIFARHQQVANLAAPATYRALVRFRWLDDAGHVLAQTSRHTALCRQPDARADLVVDKVTAQPAEQPDRVRYFVVVRNDGRADAPPFGVAFAVGDQAQPAQTVQALVAGDRRTVTFVGPRCSATAPVRVILDPDGAVDEGDEGNNVRSFGCPALG